LYGELEPHEQRRREVGIVQVIDQHGQGLVKGKMGIALGEVTQEMRQGRKAIQGHRGAHEACGAQIQALDLIGPEVLVEPRAPSHMDGIPRLEHGLQGFRAAAMDQAQMAPMPAGHQLEDDARFPVFADAENDAFISPLHPSRLPSARVFPELQM